MARSSASPHGEHPQLLTRGIEHDQGVLLLLQGLPEVVPRQVQHAGLLLFPGGLWGWRGLRAAGRVIRRGLHKGQALPSPPRGALKKKSLCILFLQRNLKAEFKDEQICTIREDILIPSEEPIGKPSCEGVEDLSPF